MSTTVWRDLGTPESPSENFVELLVDGVPVSVPEGTSVLRVASEAGLSIPKLCATETKFFFRRLNLIEISNLRVLLECHAIKLSIDRGDTNWEGNLVASHHKLHLLEKEMQKNYKNNREEWKKYDWEFHLALVSNCGSNNLLNLHSILYDKSIRYQMAVAEYRGKSAEEEHKKIFEAAISRDADQAAQTLKTHITKGLEHTLKAFK